MMWNIRHTSKNKFLYVGIPMSKIHVVFYYNLIHYNYELCYWLVYRLTLRLLTKILDKILSTCKKACHN